MPSRAAPGVVAASAQPHHRERPIVVLVDGVQRDFVAVAAAAPVGTTEEPRLNGATRGTGDAHDKPREFPALLVAARTGLTVVVPDLVRVGRLPGGDVCAMTFGVGALPCRGPLLLAGLARRLVARRDPAVAIEVLRRLDLPAGAATISKNQLVCSRLIGIQFSVSRRGLRSEYWKSEPPRTRTENRLIKSQTQEHLGVCRQRSPAFA